MKQISVKKLLLLIAVLALAAACCGTAWTPSVQAAVAWLDTDPNLPPDPNLPADPNVPAVPQPEMAFATGTLLWLSVMPADMNEPNQPPQPAPPEKA